VRGIQPSYEEKRFEPRSKRGQLRLIASPDGRDGSVTIHQDAYLHAALLDGAETVAHTPKAGRRTYVHVVRGSVTVAGHRSKGATRSSFRGPTWCGSRTAATPKCCCSTWRTTAMSAVLERGRAVERVVSSQLAPVGTFTVRRALPDRERHSVGPWVFLDHFGPFRVTRDRTGWARTPMPASRP
jgi:redox-sensitive bicupin YhaK (pirin superfamily)